MPWMLAIALFLLGYVYLGYPLFIWLLSRFGRSVKKGPFAEGVAVLIAAHNEAETLPRKLDNLRELAATEPIREIWIGLDGCTDDTLERVRTATGQEFPAPNREPALSAPLRASGPRVHLLAFENRRGKAAVLNELMARATQPVLVMMDARQRVEAGAIPRLLENFADETVGVVSGALIFESAAAGAQKQADSYWNYEKFIRRCESRFQSVPGATGALYAIRRDLCFPIPDNTLVDDVLIPMRAVLKGYRCLFEPAARVFDVPPTQYAQETLRKRRTLAGIWQLLRIEPRLFSVCSNPIWLQWISHKFLRLLTPFLILGVVAGLAGTNWLWKWAACALLACGVAAGIWTYRRGNRLRCRALGLLGALWGVNWALLLAAGDAWTGRFEARWTSRRA